MRRCRKCGAVMRWKLKLKRYSTSHKNPLKRGKYYFGRVYWCPNCGTEPL